MSKPKNENQIWLDCLKIFIEQIVADNGQHLDDLNINLDNFDNEALAFLGYAVIMGNRKESPSAETIQGELSVLFRIEVLCGSCFKIYQFGKAVQLDTDDGSTKVKCPKCGVLKIGTEYK